MASRSSIALLALIVLLLFANLLVLLRPIASPRSSQTAEIHEVLRARLIELVSDDGRVVGQLHTAEDGSANLRLRNGDGEVRVKLGAASDGSGLILMSNDAEPAVWLAAKVSGTTLTLAESGKPKRVLAP